MNQPGFQRINMQTGEVIEERSSGFKLLPPPDDCCRICAIKHDPDAAHDATSLFYQTRFRMRYGRPGTWADAVAHLPPELQEAWRDAVGSCKVEWTEPPAGVAAIAEPIDDERPVRRASLP